MKISTLYIPVFLFILLLYSLVTWSLIDSQAAADAGADGIVNVFSGKAGLIAGLVLVGLFIPKVRSPFRAVGPTLTLFCGLAVASAAWATSAGTTLFAFANLVLLLTSVIIGHRLLGFRLMMRLTWLFSTALILISVALAAIGDQHALMGGMHIGRWRGLFPHKNSFGQFLAVNLLISAFGRSSMKLPGFLIYPMVVVDIAALVMANSATALIGAATGLVAGVALLPIPNRALRYLWRFSAVACALVIGLVLLLQPDVINDAVGRDQTMTGRSDMWAQATPLTFQHKLGTGYGTGGGSQAAVELQKAMHRTTNLSVSSGYINTALELGWFAVILYFLWAGGAIISALLSAKALPAQTLLVAFLALDMVESISEVLGVFAPSWLLLMVMLPMVEVRLSKPPRFRILRRRYTSVAPANARTPRTLETTVPSSIV